MVSDDVESELAKDREVLGPVILSVSGGVFAEGDVEHPVQLVLDRPVRSGDVQKGGSAD